jgi:uncharacterized Ntn-hydrolase superfamily protein
MGAHGFADVDLRVDSAPDPIAALRALWDEYAPLVAAYATRVLDPDKAPVL